MVQIISTFQKIYALISAIVFFLRCAIVTPNLTSYAEEVALQIIICFGVMMLEIKVILEINRFILF